MLKRCGMSQRNAYSEELSHNMLQTIDINLYLLENPITSNRLYYPPPPCMGAAQTKNTPANNIISSIRFNKFLSIPYHLPLVLFKDYLGD